MKIVNHRGCRGQGQTGTAKSRRFFYKGFICLFSLHLLGDHNKPMVSLARSCGRWPRSSLVSSESCSIVYLNRLTFSVPDILSTLTSGGGGIINYYGFVLRGYISFSHGVPHFTEGVLVSLKELFPTPYWRQWWDLWGSGFSVDVWLCVQRGWVQGETAASWKLGGQSCPSVCWAQSKTSTIVFFMVAELCEGWTGSVHDAEGVMGEARVNIQEEGVERHRGSSPLPSLHI